MSRKLTGVLLLICGLMVPAFVAAQEGDHGMDAWMKHMTPGPAHEFLKAHEGKFTVKMKMWMAPEQPPMESEGTVELSMTLGGLFLQQNYSSTFMNTPMTGRGFIGYDNTRQVFVSIWMDSMSSSASFAEGKWIEEGKSFGTKGEMFDPAQGKDIKYRSVSRMIDKDTFGFDMYGITESGEEYKSMEMTYTRK